MKKSLVFIPAFFILLFFHTKGFLSHDEGWFLYATSRLLHGEIPYKDFQFLYFPGALYLTLPFFSLFDESILSARLLALCNSLLSISFLYLIGKQLRISLLRLLY